MAATLALTRRWAVRLAVGLAACVTAWAVGFVWFLVVTSGLSAPELPGRVDGIIVLTGGAGRVELALRLLEQGRGERLLVSGVGRVEFADLARRAGVDLSLAPRVTLGRTAMSTRGNAAEAAEWARSFRISTAIVVTSAYHMPRALAEMGRALPDVRLLAVPVVPAHEPLIARLRLLAGEYSKFLGAEFGMSRLAAREEQVR